MPGPRRNTIWHPALPHPGHHRARMTQVMPTPAQDVPGYETIPQYKRAGPRPGVKNAHCKIDDDDDDDDDDDAGDETQ